MDNSLKTFKLRISKGYHKVSNAYIKVSAPDASVAEELAYEMIENNDKNVEWESCPIDDEIDILIQLEEIKEIS